VKSSTELPKKSMWTRMSFYSFSSRSSDCSSRKSRSFLFRFPWLQFYPG
jgi:hypothetical protein